MDTANPTTPAPTAEAARLAAAKKLGEQLAEACQLATGLATSMHDMGAGIGTVVDDRRWLVFLAMLRAADHELGRAVR